MTLVGLVSKNGILIVEFANKLQRSGLSKMAAAREASLVRLRPVLMTSVATVCGHFPLVLVTGAGAAARNSIGIVVVSGMAIGTIFTLLVIPALYVLIAKEHGGEEPGAMERVGKQNMASSRRMRRCKSLIDVRLPTPSPRSGRMGFSFWKKWRWIYTGVRKNKESRFDAPSPLGRGPGEGEQRY